MTTLTNKSLILSVSALLFSGLAVADDSEKTKHEKSPFSLELSAGVEYDSNVSVSEIDASTDSNDYAAVVDIDLGYKLELGTDTTLDLGYGYSQSNHDEFSQFDMDTHLFSVDLSHDFGDTDLGIAYRYIDSSLDGEDFLILDQVSPYVSHFATKTVMFRADYTRTDKEFDFISERDATTDAAGADVYFFINGVRTYMVAGYKYKDEDANDNQFDFESHNFKLRLIKRFKLGKRDATFKLGWKGETRDYEATNLSIGEVRDDDRNRYQAALKVRLSKRFFVLFEYEYSDYSSNLDSANYTQNLAALKFGYSL